MMTTLLFSSLQNGCAYGDIWVEERDTGIFAFHVGREAKCIPRLPTLLEASLAHANYCADSFLGIGHLMHKLLEIVYGVMNILSRLNI